MDFPGLTDSANHAQAETPTITLSERGGIARKLKVPLFGDDPDAIEGHRDYYFDVEGRLIGSKNDGGLSIIVDAKSLLHEWEDARKVLSLEERRIDSLDDLYTIATDVKNVRDAMQAYPNIRYSTPDISAAELQLVVAEPMPLLTKPLLSSTRIRDLRYGEPVWYLDATKTPVSFGKDRWIMYKVRTVDGDEAWVFGHPAWIFPSNDEHYIFTSDEQDSLFGQRRW